MDIKTGGVLRNSPSVPFQSLEVDPALVKCEVPEGEEPKTETIRNLSCPPGTTIQDPLLEREDEEGNNIKIFCEDGEFHMYYAPVGDSRKLIGLCHAA